MSLIPLFTLAISFFLMVDDPKPTIEEAYRAWHKGLASRNKLEQEKTFKSMLAEQRDIDFLFPRYASKLWPIIEQTRKQSISNLDKFAQAFTGAGGVTGIKVTNLRESEKKREEYADLFKMIPKDVPVCELLVSYERSSASHGAYIYVNGRWIWFQAIQTIPDLIKKLN
jgi:hypothetical protein